MSVVKKDQPQIYAASRRSDHVERIDRVSTPPSRTAATNLRPSNNFGSATNVQGGKWCPGKWEETIKAVCEADRRLQPELLSWCLRYCGARLTITPNSYTPPSGITFHPRKVEIVIDHYERRLKDKRPKKEKVAILRTQVGKVAKSLAHMSLREVVIRFHEEFECGPPLGGRGDPFWTRNFTCIGDCECVIGPRFTGRFFIREYACQHQGSFLTNIATHDCNEMAIVEWILQPLASLPPCRRASVARLRGIELKIAEPFLFNKRVQSSRTYDNAYMHALFRAFERWLQGPRGRPWDKYWRKEGPRLTICMNGWLR